MMVLNEELKPSNRVLRVEVFLNEVQSHADCANPQSICPEGKLQGVWQEFCVALLAAQHKAFK